MNGLRLTGERFGVGRYIEYLLRNWTRLDGAFDRVRLFTPRAIDHPFPLPQFVEHHVVATRFANAYWEQVVLSRAHRPDDVLFCPSYVVPFSARGKVVVTHLGSYEALPAAFPLYERTKARILYQLSARRADLVITVSQSSKDDIVRWYRISPEKVVVIPLGVDRQFRPLDDPQRMAGARRALLNVDRPFVLFVGKLTARRNIPALIEAFARLKYEQALPHALVLIGHNSASLDLAGLAAQHRLEHDLVHRPYAVHESLIEFYNAADLFVYPSSYEGFGIPVVEAMACGVPTVTLCNSALAEFGSGVHFCDDSSPQALYKAMHAVLTSPQLRESLIRAGRERAKDFLWEGIARQTMDALAAIARNQN